MGLELHAATLTDDELEMEVSRKGDNQPYLIFKKKDDVKYRFVTVAGVYEATYLTRMQCISCTPHTPHKCT